MAMFCEKRPFVLSQEFLILDKYVIVRHYLYIHSVHVATQANTKSEKILDFSFHQA